MTCCLCTELLIPYVGTRGHTYGMSCLQRTWVALLRKVHSPATATSYRRTSTRVVCSVGSSLNYLADNIELMSSLGEDALANLSVEKTATGLMGHVRIRAKTQGIALSLGDRITMGELYNVSFLVLTLNPL
jgi:hypothetical protein